MSKKKKIILIVLIVAAAAVVAGVFLYKRAGAKSGGSDVVYVESVAGLSGGANAGLQNRYSGVVESQETWDINITEEQKVKEVFVEVGSEVSEGTKLFEYDTDDLGLQLAQAKLELEEMSNQIGGYNSQIKALKAEKASASQEEQFNYTVQIQSLETSIKQAEYNQESKKIEIQKLQDSISQSVVTSKIAGVVKSINEPGSTDQYGNAQPYMSILTTGDYRVKGLVNETNVWMLAEGQPVILRSRTDEEQTWTGTISTIDTENEQTENNGMYFDGMSDSEMQSSKYPFYIKLDFSDGLMLGQHVYIELDDGQSEVREGIWLMGGYIVQDEETPYVWADNGKGRLEKRPVELGDYDEEQDLYQIVSGLAVTDAIAWPQEGLAAGMRTTTNIEEATPAEPEEDGGMIDGEMIDEEMTGGEMIDGEMPDGGMIDEEMPDGGMIDEEMTDGGMADEETPEGETADGPALAE